MRQGQMTLQCITTHAVVVETLSTVYTLGIIACAQTHTPNYHSIKSMHLLQFTDY